MGFETLWLRDTRVGFEKRVARLPQQIPNVADLRFGHSSLMTGPSPSPSPDTCIRSSCCFGFSNDTILCMTDRELYPNAPIVLSAAEIRHTLCGPLEARELSRMSALLKTVLPLRSELRGVEIAFQAGPGIRPLAQEQVLAPVPRWTSRDKRTALTLRPDAMVVETTDYGSYERLRGILEVALAAREVSANSLGVERVGLRYIDEIRVPTGNGDAHPSWVEWVDASLLGPMSAGTAVGLQPAGTQGVAAFTGTDGQTLVLRYGPRDGVAVISTPELRRPTPTPGPFFLLDIDSFWEPPGEVPGWDADTVLDIVDRLHAPVHDVFESLITESLRKEVLRGE